MSLIFSDKYFDIYEADRFTIYRFNFGNHSPFRKLNYWNYNSKSVKEINNLGIYGFVYGGRYFGVLLTCIFIDLVKQYNNDFVILKLETDRNKILFQNNFEVCFSECNIIEKLTLTEFISSIYPDCLDFIEFANYVKENPTPQNFILLEKKLNHAILLY